MRIDVKYTGSTPQKYQECQQASFTPNGKLKRLFVIHLLAKTLRLSKCLSDALHLITQS